MKFLKVSRFETVNGILIPTQSIMVSKVSGKFHHKTIMTMTNIDNKTKLPQSLFTQRSLEKESNVSNFDHSIGANNDKAFGLEQSMV